MANKDLDLLMLVLCSLQLLARHNAGFPLCSDQTPPPMLLDDAAGLKFCSNRGAGDLSCCDAADDAALETQFEAMGFKPEDSACAGLIKSIICEKCNPFSVELFNTGSATRTVPLLCSSHSENSSHNKEDYCEQVWKHCKSTAISNSPFQPSAKQYAGLTGPSFVLTDFWSSENEFCAAYAGTSNNHSACFNGHGAPSNIRKLSASPTGMCLEKISDGSYTSMVAHPDGSSRAFFSTQDGKIWLVAVPEQGMDDILHLDETNPFFDLMTEGYLGSEFRLVSTAFHPDLQTMGASLFLTPVIALSHPGVLLGVHVTVIPQSSALLTAANIASTALLCQNILPKATYADPSEVRRILSMGLPYVSNHAGQLFFQPSDGYLFVLTGNSGKNGDNLSLSQSRKSLLGKILRLNINDLPDLNEAASKNLCGNYTIPEDNLSADESDLRPEIWALGLTNPGRCSFDSVKPYRLYCTDDGQGEYKVVDLISKGGNYKWSDVYEDHYGAPPPWAAQGTKPSDGIIFPVMGYKAYSATGKTTTASIVGGHVYRGSTDPCLYGRYLFADMYTSALWTGMETSDDTGKYASNAIHFRCSRESPMPCNESTNNPLGSIFSFGEDNKKDAFILTSQGVYRVVEPTICDYTCLSTPSTKGVMPSGGNGMVPLVKYAIVSFAALVSTLLGVVGLCCVCKGNNQVFVGNKIENVNVNNNGAHPAKPRILPVIELGQMLGAL
uniref:Glucose/Sorbosone dehydrogenase domain-containing protein n=1 Tax=Oryza punctata TaxID=4537 RepID=A0A0E0MN71_ORYPU